MHSCQLDDGTFIVYGIYMIQSSHTANGMQADSDLSSSLQPRMPVHLENRQRACSRQATQRVVE